MYTIASLRGIVCTHECVRDWARHVKLRLNTINANILILISKTKHAQAQEHVHALMSTHEPVNTEIAGYQ